MDNKLEEQLLGLFLAFLGIPFVVGGILLLGWIMSWGDGLVEANKAQERYEKQQSEMKRILQKEEWESYVR